MSNQCEHGQLARVCNICELQARVKELELALDSATAQRDELLRYGAYHLEHCKYTTHTLKCTCGYDDLTAQIESERKS